MLPLFSFSKLLGSDLTRSVYHDTEISCSSYDFCENKQNMFLYRNTPQPSYKILPY